MLSKELQIGKAAEHLVCADLILQGHNAFLADQGLPYDLVVDTKDGLKRVQVKVTLKPIDVTDSKSIYRFSIRRAKGAKRQFEIGSVDVFAFVALDLRCIAYFTASSLEDGEFYKGCMEFRDKNNPLIGRTYKNGNSRSLSWAKNIQDYQTFCWE